MCISRFVWVSRRAAWSFTRVSGSIKGFQGISRVINRFYGHLKAASWGLHISNRKFQKVSERLWAPSKRFQRVSETFKQFQVVKEVSRNVRRFQGYFRRISNDIQRASGRW